MPNARLRTWRGCLAFVLLVSVTACGTSGNAGSRSVSDSQSSSPLTVLGTVELPSEAWPYELVFSPDGSIWVTESSSGAIARVHPDGEVSRFQIPGSSTSPGDIVVGPDGRMWFTGALLIGQVDSGGEITGWRTGSGVNIGLPNALAVTANGDVVYTNEAIPAGVVRIRSGRFSTVEVPTGPNGAKLPGLAVAPDGALWVSVSEVANDRPDSLVRITADGDVHVWPLDTVSNPGKITVDGDGVVWFAQSTGVGRLSTDGSVTNFRPPNETRPADLIVSTDGTVWSTSPTQLGRVTPTGHVDQWPVPNAARLVGLTEADDGTLWIANAGAGMILQVSVSV